MHDADFMFYESFIHISLVWSCALFRYNCDYLFRVCLKGFVQNQEDYLHFYFHIIIRSFKFLCLYRLHPTSYQASTCHLYVWHTNMHVIVFTVYINAVFVCID